MTSKFLDDFSVGERLSSHGRTVTEADVVNYAGLTGDINPIHLDEVYARSTRYGRRLPHGQLIFALSLGLAERLIMNLFHESIIAFYGVDKLRFIKPVFIGDTIRLERIVTSIEPRTEENGLLRFADEVFNQDRELCMRYEPSYLLKRKPAR